MLGVGGSRGEFSGDADFLKEEWMFLITRMPLRWDCPQSNTCNLYFCQGTHERIASMFSHAVDPDPSPAIPQVPTLLCEFAERRKILYGIRPFLELGIRRIPWNTWNTGGIRQNTGLWEVIWNTWKTYSHSRTPTRPNSENPNTVQKPRNLDRRTSVQVWLTP